MDPYFSITYNGKEYRTRTHNEAGKHPEWHESFDIDIQSLNDDIVLAIFDEDLTDNEVVGERKFKVRAICQAALTMRVIPLNFKGKNSADITIESKFTKRSELMTLNEINKKLGHKFENLRI